jgi:succinate dehydrogenase/fumarate reductase cytochrome b subunit
MSTNKIHYFSGLIITLFVGLHLFNHTWSVLGADQHIEMMNSLRLIYRNFIVESVLLIAVIIQITSGLKLFLSPSKNEIALVDKLHRWTGLYLAIFLVIHLSAVLVGRLVLNLDTNFYFGVAGLNSFPFNLFFIPYYSLAILSFFGHVACIHNKKMKSSIFSLSPNLQSITIFTIGICLTLIIFFGLTNRFKGVTIPKEYEVLIGK